jgi:hypothetical protein
MATVFDSVVKALALALLSGPGGTQLVQAVDGRRDLAGVLGIAAGHGREVGQQRLERGLLAVEALPPAAMICSSSVVETAPNTSAPPATNCTFGDFQADVLIAQNSGAVDRGGDIVRNPHTAEKVHDDLCLVTIKRDGRDMAHRDVGQLHLGAIGQVPNVREDGRGSPRRRTGSATAGQRQRDEQGAGPQQPRTAGHQNQLPTSWTHPAKSPR